MRENLAKLRGSEVRVAILSTRASQLSADLALSIEEYALEDELTRARVSAAAKLDELERERGTVAAKRSPPP